MSYTYQQQHQRPLQGGIPPHISTPHLAYASPRPPHPAQPQSFPLYTPVHPQNAYLQQQQRIIAAQQHILASQQPLQQQYRPAGSQPRPPGLVSAPPKAAQTGAMEMQPVATMGGYAYAHLQYPYPGTNGALQPPLPLQQQHVPVQQPQTPNRRQTSQTPQMAHAVVPLQQQQQPMGGSQTHSTPTQAVSRQTSLNVASRHPTPSKAMERGHGSHVQGQVGSEGRSLPGSAAHSVSAPTPATTGPSPATSSHTSSHPQAHAHPQPQFQAQSHPQPHSTMHAGSTSADAGASNYPHHPTNTSLATTAASSPIKPNGVAQPGPRGQRLPVSETPAIGPSNNRDPLAQRMPLFLTPHVPSLMVPASYPPLVPDPSQAYPLAGGLPSMGAWLDHEDVIEQPGAAVDAVGHFAHAMGNMAGGSMPEWTGFVREHFDEASRVQMTLLSRSKTDLRLFDVPITSLPRVLSTWNTRIESWSLNLHSHSESPLSTDSASGEMDFTARRGVQVESEGEWRMVYAAPAGLASNAKDGSQMDKKGQGEENGAVEVVWKVSILSTWVEVFAEGVLQLDGLEISVNDWTVGPGHQGVVGDLGLPDRVVDVLEITQGMEDMAGVIELAQDGYPPKVALKALTQERKVPPASAAPADPDSQHPSAGPLVSPQTAEERAPNGSTSGIDQEDWGVASGQGEAGDEPMNPL